MEYVLSIAGVVFLGVMLDVISPEGKMNTFIKSIFSLFLLFVMTSPIVNLVSKNSLSKLFNTEITLQEEYLSEVNNQILNEYEHKLIKMIETKGILNVDVEITGNMTEENRSVEKVVVNTQNMVLINSDKHINKYEVITECVEEILGVGREVIVYE